MFFALLSILPFAIMQAAAPAESMGLSEWIATAEPLRGIYLTSSTIASPAGEKIVSDFAAKGGNMVTFDIQDSAGRFAYMSKSVISAEIGNRKDQIKDLPAVVARLREQGIYSVARFVLFKNGFLARKKPAWTIKRKGANRSFVSRDGPIWLDPGNPELKQYYLEIAREFAEAGVDEVQFDYARFPEGGKGGYIGYSFTGDDVLTRDQAITQFVADLSDELHSLGVKTSVDVFGIVVWDNVSWKLIGQNIHELGKAVDFIAPMPYPSHFGPGWGGHKNPADEPYYFVQETTRKFIEQTYDTPARIRPWLQGFAMRVSRYGSSYVKEQIRSLADIGIYDFTVWNARNDYRVTFPALEAP